jgi:hypothetical protein
MHAEVSGMELELEGHGCDCRPAEVLEERVSFKFQ